jgi:hypothetical protein
MHVVPALYRGVAASLRRFVALLGQTRSTLIDSDPTGRDQANRLGQ